MWTYEQSTGQLFHNGVFHGAGYAGNGAGLNNPAMQDVSCVGPLPRGRYRIVGPPYDSPKVGKCVLNLEPDPGNEMFGRSAFRMHGERLPPAPPKEASEGCIVQARDVRVRVWASGDRDLEVVA